eukprot:1177656-Amphidinium_carterae.1
MLTHVQKRLPGALHVKAFDAPSSVPVAIHFQHPSIRAIGQIFKDSQGFIHARDWSNDQRFAAHAVPLQNRFHL